MQTRHSNNCADVLCLDVSVLVYAQRADLPDNGRYGELDIDARGPDIADAYLAAYALDNNATFVSADRGFARFSRLKWRRPLDG
jgi:predicted nucleic acid-binding protein